MPGAVQIGSAPHWVMCDFHSSRSVSEPLTVIVKGHPQQLAIAGGEPGPFEVDAQPAAEAHAALEVGLGLALPAKGGHAGS